MEEHVQAKSARYEEHIIKQMIINDRQVALLHGYHPDFKLGSLQYGCKW